jgi:hypothetical protein
MTLRDLVVEVLWYSRPVIGDVRLGVAVAPARATLVRPVDVRQQLRLSEATLVYRSRSGAADRGAGSDRERYDETYRG